jgi:hypothetical protein
MSSENPKSARVIPGQAELAPGEISLPQRTTPALLASLAMHVFLLTTIGLIWSRAAKGTGEPADRPVGIAMVHQMADRERFVDTRAIEPTDPEQNDQATDASASAAAAAPPADLSPPIDLRGVLKAMESTPSPVAGTGLAGETELTGDAFGSGRGASQSADSGAATTTVFGVSGSGSRFVYVFDRSDSMNGFGGRPLRAAKSELLRSLQSLTDRQRFQIVFYNDKPTPFRIEGMPAQLIAGEDSYLARAEQYVNSVAAFGGTEHNDAIKLALRMSPDVIFFLTDARIPRLSSAQLQVIQDRADRSGTTIHAIEFGAEPVAPADSFLRDLAAMNNGQYQYVDVRQLGKPADQAVDADQGDGR